MSKKKFPPFHFFSPTFSLILEIFSTKHYIIKTLLNVDPNGLNKVPNSKEIYLFNQSNKLFIDDY